MIATARPTALAVIRSYRMSLAVAALLPARDVRPFLDREEQRIYRELCGCMGIADTLKQAHRTRRIFDRMSGRWS